MIDKTQIVQIGILTHDLKKCTEYWAKFLGEPVPEFEELPPYEESRALYNGKPCHGKTIASFFRLENVQIELIQPIGDEPSYWKDCLDKNGEGFHHIAFAAKDMERTIEELEAEGFGPLKQFGYFPRGAYAYFDTQDSLQMIVELLERGRDS